MKFKNFSFYFYASSFAIILISFIFSPEIMSSLEFNLNDLIDTGYSNYIEKVSFNTSSYIKNTTTMQVILSTH